RGAPAHHVGQRHGLGGDATHCRADGRWDDHGAADLDVCGPGGVSPHARQTSTGDTLTGTFPISQRTAFARSAQFAWTVSSRSWNANVAWCPFQARAFPRSLVDRMTVMMLVTFVCVCTVIGQLRINPFM